jgi:hypothetical protein
MRATREKIQKINIELFLSNILKAQEISRLLDKWISSSIRQLIDDTNTKRE